MRRRSGKNIIKSLLISDHRKKILHGQHSLKLFYSTGISSGLGVGKEDQAMEQVIPFPLANSLHKGFIDARNRNKILFTCAWEVKHHCLFFLGALLFQRKPKFLPCFPLLFHWLL